VNYIIVGDRSHRHQKSSKQRSQHPFHNCCHSITDPTMSDALELETPAKVLNAATHQHTLSNDGAKSYFSSRSRSNIDQLTCLPNVTSFLATTWPRQRGVPHPWEQMFPESQRPLLPLCLPLLLYLRSPSSTSFSTKMNCKTTAIQGSGFRFLRSPCTAGRSGPGRQKWQKLHRPNNASLS
jgi:hypothetical protein